MHLIISGLLIITTINNIVTTTSTVYITLTAIIVLLLLTNFFLIRKKAWAKIKAIWDKAVSALKGMLVKVLKYFSLLFGRSFLNLYNWLNKEQINVNRPLGDMTATHDAGDIAVYEKKLEEGIGKRAIINIALAGPNGAGKTSIIRTFFRRNPQYKPLIVSLAAFKDDRKEQPEEDTDATLEGTTTKKKPATKIEPHAKTEDEQKILNERIEYSILQQLFYHVSGNEIPFSRFQRIRPVSWVKILSTTLFITIIAYASFYCYSKTWHPVFQFPTLLLQLIKTLFTRAALGFNWPDFFAGGLVVFGIMAIVSFLFRLGRLGLLKLNMQGAELEISGKKDLSILNQHLDEIMYFFISTRYDVLIFEDLDRFRNPEIFVKLREISTLVNNSVEVKRKVTFIYALRDDVFLDEKRTKFFDFIIPVVPITNSTNSAAELINKFRTLHLEKPIPDIFLNDLSLFISDKRLIENIVSEFDIYKTQLATPELDNKMLLALIVYKNLHPTDFSDLQINKGMVYDLFQMRTTLIQEKIKEFETGIDQKEITIKQLITNHLKSINELRLCYLSAFFQKAFETTTTDLSGKIELNGGVYAVTELTEDSLFNQIQTNPYFQFRCNRGSSNYDVSIRFQDVEKLVDSTQTYVQREKKLSEVLVADLTRENADLWQLKEHLSRVKGYTMQEVFKIKRLSDISTPINQHPALAYLIGNGYITEDYRYYLSQFKPGQLEHVDREFLLSLKSQKFKPWSHPLSKVELVAEWVTETECTDSTILNFELLDYLIRTSNSHRSKMDLIVKQLAKSGKKGMEFIHAFRNYAPQSMGKLVSLVASYAPEFWDTINSYFPHDQSENVFFLRLIFDSCSLEQIESLNVDGRLLQAISNDSYFISLADMAQVDKMKQILEKHKLKFQNAPETHNISFTILEKVYQESLYQLTPQWVEYMIKHHQPHIPESTLIAGQLTCILNSDLTFLKEYININMEEYLNNVYFFYNDHSQESNETITKVLQHQNISNDLKNKFIESTAFQLDEISSIPAALHDNILSRDRIRPTWNNLDQYILTNVESEGKSGIRGYTEVLVAWISKEKNHKEIVRTKIGPYPEKEVDDLDSNRDTILALINDRRITLETRQLLSTAIEFKIKSISDYNLQKDMIDMLLPKMEYNENTAFALKKVDFTKFIHFTLQHWSEFEKLADKLELTSDELIELFYSGLTTVQRHFLYTQMSQSEILKLLHYGTKIPREVLEFPAFSMTAEQLQSLSGKMDPETTVNVMIANMDNLTEESATPLLDALGGHYKKISKKQGKEVEKSESMEALITSLHQKGLLIESYQPKKSVIEVKFKADDEN